MKYLNFEMDGNWDRGGWVPHKWFWFLTSGMAFISIDYMAKATYPWLTDNSDRPLRNVMLLSQQWYFRFLRVLRLRLSAAHSSPHLFLAHKCSIGIKSGDNSISTVPYYAHANTLSCVFSMLLPALMELQQTKK